ncbi:MAG: hypothetical protein GF375_05535 [Candidatus Omnitrophica bacterium]|nr:hypothetical protein [Candidatus Omnitrophota bacterium]MBD3269450.1 hypothetical protein [Candidatus Omnitrophota bacterium]
MISFNEESQHDKGEPLDFKERRKQRWAALNDYKESYTPEDFIEDLQVYFENEIDFNLETVRQIISKEGELDKLKNRAEANSSHPVTEFLLEIFKDSFH